MSGCTGRCSQGRACDCFDDSGVKVFAGVLTLAALAVVGVCLFAVWSAARHDIAGDCSARGHFVAMGADFECRPVEVRP